jgi:hypothetical protein
VTKKSLLIGTMFFVLSGLIGALFLKQLPAVQRIQAVFLMANEQIIHADCSAAANGPWTTVQGNTLTGPCNLVLRARDLYDGVTFPEALEAFQHDLNWDQIRFAALFAGLSLAAMLGLAGVQRLLSTRNRDKQTLGQADLPAPGRL